MALMFIFLGLAIFGFLGAGSMGSCCWVSFLGTGESEESFDELEDMLDSVDMLLLKLACEFTKKFDSYSIVFLLLNIATCGKMTFLFVLFCFSIKI
jgi:hypothetical protein